MSALEGIVKLKSGQRLKSQVCAVNVIVVRAPDDAMDLRCGGVPMVDMDVEVSGGELDPQYAGGTAMGKRYGTDELELLCTKPGEGGLSLGSDPIGVKAAKALPASD